MLKEAKIATDDAALLALLRGRSGDDDDLRDLDKGDPGKAIESYQMAVHLSPDYADYRLALALLLHDVGRLRESQEQLAKARALRAATTPRLRDGLTHESYTAAGRAAISSSTSACPADRAGAYPGPKPSSRSI